MPIAPKPFKWVCPKCGYSKTITPKSDTLNPIDMINTCPKCSEKMVRKEVGALDILKGLFTN
jgi:ribosomal protein S27AE